MTTDDVLNDLAGADQSVKDFMADIFEALNAQLKRHQDPCIQLEYFGVTIEIRLIAFGHGDGAEGDT